MIWCFTVSGRCTPCPRPRVARGKRAYFPKRYTDWLERAQVEALSEYGRPLWDGPVELSVWFCGARANADIDNLLKSVLDAIQGILIVDDKQVRVVHAWKESADGEQPTTSIEVSAFRDGGE